MRARRGVFGIALASLALALGICAQPAWSAAPLPAFSISQTSMPTNFAPGSEAERVELAPNSAGVLPRYSTVIRNVGGATTSEPVVITDTLPSGVTPAAEAPAIYKVFANDENTTGICPTSGQTVHCEVSYPIAPFETIEVYVPLDAGTVPGKIVNELTVAGGGADIASNRIENEISSAAAPFGFLPDQGFALTASDEQGNGPLAGAHPFLTEFTINIPTKEGSLPSQGLKNIGVELPQGLVVNPSSTAARCTDEEINSAVRFPSMPCPTTSQVGEIAIELPGLGLVPEPLYNMVPPPGQSADLAFTLLNVTVHILGGVNNEYHLTAKSSNLLTRYHIAKIYVSLWGDPSDPRFNRFRLGAGCEHGGCSIETSPEPFVTMPTSCSEPENAFGEIESWQDLIDRQTVPLADRNFEPIEVAGCNQLAFSPSIESRATTNQGESPTGFEFFIHQPQEGSLTGRSTAALKNVTATLPAGVSINTAAANGHTSCTEEQMGYAPVGGKIRFQAVPQTCPNSAKLGTVEASTPLLDHELQGGIYLAKPFANPFGTLVALYLAVEDEESGVITKLAGKVEPDPQTGQLTTTFTEDPELPLEDIDLRFFNGSNAPLTTPLTCGAKSTTTTLTPWSSPEGVDVHPTGSFETTANCYGSEAAAPKTVSFTAGTESPLAGAYSPFSLRLSRADATQHITGIETKLPGGLLGKLAGIPYCPESGIAQARSREAAEAGKLEQASPSCPAASEVGTVQVTAGSGITPIPVSGHAYLAGPYKGAPLSLVIITPAVAGPFDLGNVVTRVALYVDETTAQLRAVADPLPTIRDGIPLDVRSIELKISRPGFMLNPTSCESTQISGAVTSATGAATPLVNHFQVGECSRLAFKPKFGISFSGAPTRRGGHPQLRALIKAAAGEANIGRATVTLPKTEFLDNAHIRTVCTRVQYAAETCPQASIYGYAKAWTPLLDKPLEGPVYLRSSSNTLPDLVASLNGQIKISLDGKITSTHGRVRNTFETVPDAPVSKFELVMRGRGKGLLVNNTELCLAKPRATANFVGQNGKVESADPLVKVAGCGKKNSKHRHGKKGGRRHAKGPGK